MRQLTCPMAIRAVEGRADNAGSEDEEQSRPASVAARPQPASVSLAQGRAGRMCAESQLSEAEIAMTSGRMQQYITDMKGGIHQGNANAGDSLQIGKHVHADSSMMHARYMRTEVLHVAE